MQERKYTTDETPSQKKKRGRQMMEKVRHCVYFTIAGRLVDC